MNKKELEKIKQKALEEHIPIIMDDTLEEASDMRLSKGAFNATTYRRIYYLINNVLKVR